MNTLLASTVYFTLCLLFLFLFFLLLPWEGIQGGNPGIKRKIIPQCTTRVFLGVGCNTVQRRFYVPEDNLRKLEAMLRDAVDSRSISLSQLKQLTGKCTSMAVVVPPASLYTHHMYRQIAVIKRSEGREGLSSIAVV